MKNCIYSLALLGFIIFFITCTDSKYKKKYTTNWYLNNTEPLLKAWIESDSIYFENYIINLEKEKNKNIYYSNLSDLYLLSNRVIIPFDDSCQNEIHHVYKDLIIDSDIEIMNKTNTINGLKIYFKSELLFRCNLNKDTLEYILNTTWKKCSLMTEKDLETLLIRYNAYANTLPKCDTCKYNYFDSTITYIRCY